MVVLPLGDSITRGDSLNPVGGFPGGYRTRFYQELTNGLGAVDFIGSETTNPDPPALPDPDHQGVSGERIDQIMGNYVTRLAGRPVPDVVLLHAGSNDMIQNWNAATATNRLDQLIGVILGECSRTRIVVARIIGCTADAAVDARIATFNEGVAQVAAARQAAGWPVTLVNMDEVVRKETDFSDGYHPNRQGYDRMGDAWYAAVSGLGALPPVRGQTLVQSNAVSASQTAFQASAADLVNAGSSSLAGVDHQDYTGDYGAPIAALNDGLTGGIDAIGASAFDDDANWRSTFTLDTALHPAGHDITRIDTIAAWQASRTCQKFELYLSFVGAPAVFISYGFHAVTNDQGGASRVTLTDPSGRIATGVAAVRFDFKAPRTGLVSDEPTVREVDVFGEPTVPIIGTVVVVQ